MSPRVSKVLGLVLPQPSYYGWVIVGACSFCAALSGPGQSFALGLYLDVIARDLEVSRLSVSALYGWATLAAALLLPIAGRLADVTSSRVFLGSVVAALGVSLLFLGAVGSLPALAVAFFALRLLAQGATGLGTLTTILRWFREHRGRAVALAALGYAIGEFALPDVVLGLQAKFGWRSSLFLLGSVYLLVFAPLVALAVKAPDAARSPETSPTDTPEPEITAGQAARMPIFWCLALLASVIPFTVTGVMLHQLPLFESAGWEPGRVAVALKGYAVSGLIGAYATGVLLDRVPSKTGLTLALMSLFGAMLVPFGAAGVPGAELLFGMTLGCAAGAANATNGVLWPDYFGVRSVGAIKGLVSTVRNGATAVAAPLVVLLAAPTGSYRAPLLAGACLAGSAVVLCLLLPRPKALRALRPHVST